MRDLLPDNIALAERLAKLPANVGQGKPPEQREVGSLMTWVSSFATYVAIVAQAHPDRVTDMLAYMRLIIREASKFGGNGWLTYDAVFPRNQEGSSQLWNVIDPSLHIAYIAGQKEPAITPCPSCQEVDHPSSVCAVAPLIPRLRLTPRDYHMARVSEPLVPFRGKRPAPYRLPPPTEKICISWNKGNCRYPGACTYAHVCAICKGTHPASTCASAPRDSTLGSELRVSAAPPGEPRCGTLP